MFTNTEYDYYPIPAIYLEECVYPTRKPTTVQELLTDYRITRQCARRGNEDKNEIEELIEGGLFNG